MYKCHKLDLQRAIYYLRSVSAAAVYLAVTCHSDHLSLLPQAGWKCTIHVAECQCCGWEDICRPYPCVTWLYTI